MSTKKNAQPDEGKTSEAGAVLAPSLKSFVQLVKKSLTSKTKNAVKPSEMIKNVERLEQKMSNGSGRWPCTGSSCDGDTLLLDPILHHRVILAAGIAKSYASGADLSGKRRKILQSNIEYIENHL